MTGATNKAKLFNEENLKVAFEVFDRNNDGYISSDEIKERFSNANFDGMTELNVGEDFWQKLIDSCDSNGDGFISWEEFRQNMNKLLTLQSEVDSYQQF